MRFPGTIRKTGAILLFLVTVTCGPAMARTMDEADIQGGFYAVSIKDLDGVLSTAFSSLTADGAGLFTFDRLYPAGESRLAQYAVFDNGKITTKNPDSLNFGVEKGSVSLDGVYLTLANMLLTTNGGLPELLFAIHQSTGLTNTVLGGGYNVSVFYKAPAEGSGNSANYTTSGEFLAIDGMLSGAFIDPIAPENQPLNGNYEIACTVMADGQITLTLTSGAIHEAFAPLQGVISGDGNTFVAVETGPEDGSLAFVVGVRQPPAGLALSDMEGDYYVADFGYYLLDDALGNDVANFLMDLSAGPDGNFSFLEEDTTCPDCSINTVINGTLAVSPGENHYTALINGYPDDLKKGGRISLAPDGNVFAMVGSLYLGIGIPRASGQADPGEPIANAGTDQAVSAGTAVLLDGSGSNDPDGMIVSYKWQTISGDPALISAITLSDDAAVQTSFIAPNIAGGIIFRLSVMDNDGNTDSDWVRITVGGNAPPTADAGPDQTVAGGELVTLDGSGSSDPDDGIGIYTWTQPVGPAFSLSDIHAIQPTFTAPPVDAPTPLMFQLTVQDHTGLTAMDTVDIIIDPDINGNGMPDSMESADTDLDGDGVLDFNDPDSIRFQGINGGFLGFYTCCGELFEVRNLLDTDTTVPQTGRPAGTCPYGVFSYNITGLTPGAQAEVTFVFPEALPENAAFHKIDGNGWRPISFVRGELDNTLIVTLTDGDPLTDDDGTANGIIVDPSALVLTADDTTPDNTSGGGSSGGGCFIRSLMH